MQRKETPLIVVINYNYNPKAKVIIDSVDKTNCNYTQRYAENTNLNI